MAIKQIPFSPVKTSQSFDKGNYSGSQMVYKYGTTATQLILYEVPANYTLWILSAYLDAPAGDAYLDALQLGASISDDAQSPLIIKSQASTAVINPALPIPLSSGCSVKLKALNSVEAQGGFIGILLPN